MDRGSDFRYDAASSKPRAGVAQLVEYELPKLVVAGSIPVARSNSLLSAGCLDTPGVLISLTEGVRSFYLR